jgi:hypothetical protein
LHHPRRPGGTRLSFGEGALFLICSEQNREAFLLRTRGE